VQLDAPGRELGGAREGVNRLVEPVQRGIGAAQLRQRLGILRVLRDDEVELLGGLGELALGEIKAAEVEVRRRVFGVLLHVPLETLVG
jgi:hypothetical protein